MNATPLKALPQHLTVVLTLSHLLQKMEADPSLNADQYRSVVQRLSEALSAVPADALKVQVAVANRDLPHTVCPGVLVQRLDAVEGTPTSSRPVRRSSNRRGSAGGSPAGSPPARRPVPSKGLA